jgi:hypothetical protein
MQRKSSTPKVDGQCEFPGCPKRLDWSVHDKPPQGWAHIVLTRYGKKDGVKSATRLVCPEHTMDFAPRVGRLPDRTTWKRVLIESPFHNSDPKEIEENVQYVRAIMRECLLNGEAPFASHALYTLPGVLNDGIPSERTTGIQAGLEWGEAADKTVVYTDRGVSDGMRVGIARADQQDRMVEFRKLKGWDK